MTRSSCPRWKRPEAPLPLQTKVTNWPLSDEIDARNDDLAVTITEVIAGHTIPTENLLISLKILFGLVRVEIVQSWRRIEILNWRGVECKLL